MITGVPYFQSFWSFFKILNMKKQSLFFKNTLLFSLNNSLVFKILILLSLLQTFTPSLHANKTDDNLKFDIGLYNPSCANFEVRLKPNQTIASSLSNIQFTLKWPENSFEITGITTDYSLEQQGPKITIGGFNYAVFVSVPASGKQINWTADTEYTIMTFLASQNGSGNVDVILSTDSWSSQNNGLFYVELFGDDKTGSIYHNALNANAECLIKAYLKVILQGAYDETNQIMRTSINQAGNLPKNQPYSIAPWLYAGLEQVTSFNSDIVDWVLVELRDKIHPEIIKATRACLLSKNGDVLDIDHSTGIKFEAEADDYFLVVKHRNHLPVMSSAPISLPNEMNVYNFTTKTNLQQLELEPSGSGFYGMIAGNVKADNQLRYNNENNDRGLILELINIVTGTINLNNTVSGYYLEDTSLDNQVIYNNINNDRSIIILNLKRLTGSPNLNLVYTSTVE